MSLKKIHDKQPEKFEFTKENLDLANNILKKYPKDRICHRISHNGNSCGYKSPPEEAE